ncbi:PPE family protein [Candidatus Mycobacterium wuenschmannii]|uniref:PPE family protein n=1 Tax=Candidatus Mycobacterium wuenschmannii TaxID=3027808 RepID=A0ABY8W151_9MYCO|nr:PPE family protein [Candidatus Mycobacterium wuenschmannii]WIM89613.1 PPE family protein [Candidatus Mycobacterium wuenschmannii]
MQDYGSLPPEVNSGRMYAGPGSGSLMTAASAWNQLAAELSSAAIGYERVLTELSSEQWLGPASTAMAAAATPYVEWMNATAAQAEQAASQARASAAAYETALATMVPVPLIAANREALAEALAYNVFGQYNGEIAAIEAQYGQMWAQDAGAMYSYAGQSAATTTMTPFTDTPTITSPGAQAAQTAATHSAAATSAGTSQSALSQLTSTIPTQLSGMAAPVAADASSTSALSEIWFLISGQTALPSNLGTLLNGVSPFSSLLYNTEGLPYFSVGMGNFGIQMGKTLGLLNGVGGAAAGGAATAPATGLGNLGGLLGGGAPVNATLGTSDVIGDISVPPNWAQVSGASSGAARVAHHTMTPASAEPGNMLGGMPLSAPHGGAAATGPKYGFRPKVMARPPFAG